jgi:hypothetical protein
MHAINFMYRAEFILDMFCVQTTLTFLYSACVYTVRPEVLLSQGVRLARGPEALPEIREAFVLLVDSLLRSGHVRKCPSMCSCDWIYVDFAKPSKWCQETVSIVACMLSTSCTEHV